MADFLIFAVRCYFKDDDLQDRQTDGHQIVTLCSLWVVNATSITSYMLIHVHIDSYASQVIGWE